MRTRRVDNWSLKSQTNVGWKASSCCKKKNHVRARDGSLVSPFTLMRDGGQEMLGRGGDSRVDEVCDQTSCFGRVC